jgi:hypothetical protein
MSDVKQLACPSCKQERLKDHCGHTDSVDCGWLKCTNTSCKAVLDRIRRKGFKPAGIGKFEHFTFGQLGGASP